MVEISVHIEDRAITNISKYRELIVEGTHEALKRLHEQRQKQQSS